MKIVEYDFQNSWLTLLFSIICVLYLKKFSNQRMLLTNLFMVLYLITIGGVFMSENFEKAQQFGKSFMLPIAILPAAGLLLGIGGALSNPNTIKAYPILDVDLLQYIFILMSSAGDIVFANLPVIFAIGVAIGLARSDKGTAGLAAMLGFLIMNATMNALLTITD